MKALVNYRALGGEAEKLTEVWLYQEKCFKYEDKDEQRVIMRPRDG